MPRNRQENSETVSDFIAAIKQLSVYCNFDNYLKDALWDRLVCELRCETIPKQLLQEGPLSFDKACSITSSMEMTQKDTTKINVDNKVRHILRKSETDGTRQG